MKVHGFAGDPTRRRRCAGICTPRRILRASPPAVSPPPAACSFAAWQRGGLAAWRLGGLAAWWLGAWRHGSLAAWRLGGLANGRPGGLAAQGLSAGPGGGKFLIPGRTSNLTDWQKQDIIDNNDSMVARLARPTGLHAINEPSQPGGPGGAGGFEQDIIYLESFQWGNLVSRGGDAGYLGMP